MASAKQIAWRKKFARMSKAGKFKKSKKTKKKVGKLAGNRLVSVNPKKIGEVGFPANDYFKEYKRLGGKKNRRQFDKNVDIFTHHTWDIFIHGDATKYDSRQEALEAVKKEANIDNKELNLIFESIDNVTAYT